MAKDIYSALMTFQPKVIEVGGWRVVALGWTNAMLKKYGMLADLDIAYRKLNLTRELELKRLALESRRLSIWKRINEERMDLERKRLALDAALQSKKMDLMEEELGLRERQLQLQEQEFQYAVQAYQQAQLERKRLQEALLQGLAPFGSQGGE